MTQFRADDLVIVNPDATTGHQYKGIVYKVEKINPKSVGLCRADGQPGRLAAPAEILLPAPDGMAAAAAAAAQTVSRFCLGQVVTISAPGWSDYAEQLFVVIRGGINGYTVARLGSDTFSWFKNIPAAALVRAEVPEFRPAGGNPFMFSHGQVVTVSAPSWKRHPDELFVVINSKRGGYDIAKLGGNKGTDGHWTKVPQETLTLMTAA